MTHSPTLEQRTFRSRLAQNSLKMILFILRLMQRVPITEGVAVALLRPFHLWLERRRSAKTLSTTTGKIYGQYCHRLYIFVLFHFQLPDELQEVHVKRFLPIQLMKSARMSSMTHRPTPEQRTSQFGLDRSSLKMTDSYTQTDRGSSKNRRRQRRRSSSHLWQQRRTSE